MREGSPERISRSWQLVRRSVAPTCVDEYVSSRVRLDPLTLRNKKTDTPGLPCCLTYLSRPRQYLFFTILAVHLKRYQFTATKIRQLQTSVIYG